ncbi:hypothetical protein IW150_002070 [Coemansia sp. RSA 2607]|nr:hypothetical protein IW150_002070 [Coemansia sp. RSA 2607]
MSVSKPVAEPAVELVAEPVADSVAEPIAEPVAEPAVEPEAVLVTVAVPVKRPALVQVQELGQETTQPIPEPKLGPNNVDNQTIVAYGEDKLQFWDTGGDGLVGVWNGDQARISIEQGEPVSPSTLAIVSSGGQETEQASEAGRLFFMDVNWSSEKKRFSNLPIRQWVGDSQSGTNISIVKGVRPQDDGDKSRVSLFTGGLTGGAVYRRIFDISESKVNMVTEQEMVNRHRGSVSALCHVEVQDCIISGTTFGTISLNDHQTGASVQMFELGDDTTIGSATSCPFNSNLFMVGCCKPKSKLLIFDMRQKLKTPKPSLILRDANTTTTSRYSSPSWNRHKDLVFAPVRRLVDGKEIGAVDIWDPRFIKFRGVEKFIPYEGVGNIYSVDFIKRENKNPQIMVTASEDTIDLTSLSFTTY